MYIFVRARGFHIGVTCSLSIMNAVITLLAGVCVTALGSTVPYYGGVGGHSKHSHGHGNSGHGYTMHMTGHGYDMYMYKLGGSAPVMSGHGYDMNMYRHGGNGYTGHGHNGYGHGNGYMAHGGYGHGGYGGNGLGNGYGGNRGYEQGVSVTVGDVGSIPHFDLGFMNDDFMTDLFPEWMFKY